MFDGIVCNQKVGRHETGGEKEVWEFVMEKGICVEWDSPHPDWDLYVVKEGRVEVTVLGGTFVAARAIRSLRRTPGKKPAPHV